MSGAGRTPARRPGTGGRPPTETTIDELKLLGEVADRYELVSRRSVSGAQEWLGLGDPDGNGAIFNRISSSEARKGEGLGVQNASNAYLAERVSLQARYVVATWNNSGANDLDRRPDLMRLGDWVREGWVEWVMWRGPDRMFRRGALSEAHYEWLQAEGITLYLAELSRAIDWNSEADISYLTLSGMLSSMERRNVLRRTHGALISRWLASGRGWPSAQVFGCRRDNEMFLEVDPLQWKQVHFMFRRYLELAEERQGGLRPLSEEMHEAGCTISPSHLAKLLQDPIYVDGHSSVRYAEQRYTVEPLRRLGDGPDRQPVPRDLFQQVQEVLATRHAPNTRTPIGTFLLNSVPFLHEDCQHLRGGPKNRPKTSQPRLRARGYADDRTKNKHYGHMPWVPDGCRGWTLHRDQVDRAVIEAVREVASAPELPQEWAAAQRPEVLDSPATVSAAEQAALRAELAQLRIARQGAEDRFFERIAAGEAADERIFGKMLEGFDRRIEQTEKRLATARPGRPAPKRPPGPTDEELRERLLEVLTVETPDDPAHRLRRAALLTSCLSHIVAKDLPDGSVELQLYGPLLPHGVTANAGEHGPLGAVRRQMAEEQRRKTAGRVAAREAADAVKAVAPAGGGAAAGSGDRGAVAAGEGAAADDGAGDGAATGEDGPSTHILSAWGTPRGRYVSPASPKTPIATAGSFPTTAPIGAGSSELPRLLGPDGIPIQPHAIVAATMYGPDGLLSTVVGRRKREKPRSRLVFRTGEQLDGNPAWCKRVTFKRLPRRDPFKRKPDYLVAASDAVAGLAFALVEHPHLSPLTRGNHALLPADPRWPSPNQLATVASHSGISVPQLRRRATRRFWQLRPEGPPTAVEEASLTAPLGRERTWTSLGQIREQLVLVLLDQPHLAPLNLKQHHAAVEFGAPSRQVMGRFCRGTDMTPGLLAAECLSEATKRADGATRRTLAAAEGQTRVRRREQSYEDLVSELAQAVLPHAHLRPLSRSSHIALAAVEPAVNRHDNAGHKARRHGRNPTQLYADVEREAKRLEHS